MKEVTLSNGRTIKTPWLRIEEAAAYCGLSRSAFTEHSMSKDIPHSGNERTRLYNIKVLDAWLNGTYGPPFETEIKPTTRRRRQPHKKPGERIGLIHPITGKIFKPKESC